LRIGLVTGEELVGATDEGLMHLLASRAHEARDGGHAAGRLRSDDAVAAGAAARVATGVRALRERQLPKRAAEVAAADLDGAGAGEWLASDTSLKRDVEEALARELELAPGAVYLDYPEKSMMFGLHLLVRRRSGEVLRLGPEGRSGLIGLPEVAAELYRTARVLRLFTHGERRSVSARAVMEIAQRSAQSMRSALDEGVALLS